MSTLGSRCSLSISASCQIRTCWSLTVCFSGSVSFSFASKCFLKLVQLVFFVFKQFLGLRRVVFTVTLVFTFMMDAVIFRKLSGLQTVEIVLSTSKRANLAQALTVHCFKKFLLRPAHFLCRLSRLSADGLPRSTAQSPDTGVGRCLAYVDHCGNDILFFQHTLGSRKPHCAPRLHFFAFTVVISLHFRVAVASPS